MVTELIHPRYYLYARYIQSRSEFQRICYANNTTFSGDHLIRIEQFSGVLAPTDFLTVRQNTAKFISKWRIIGTCKNSALNEQFHSFYQLGLTFEIEFLQLLSSMRTFLLCIVLIYQLSSCARVYCSSSRSRVYGSSLQSADCFNADLSTLQSTSVWRGSHA